MFFDLPASRKTSKKSSSKTIKTKVKKQKETEKRILSIADLEVGTKKIKKIKNKQTKAEENIALLYYVLARKSNLGSISRKDIFKNKQRSRDFYTLYTLAKSAYKQLENLFSSPDELLTALDAVLDTIDNLHAPTVTLLVKLLKNGITLEQIFFGKNSPTFITELEKEIKPGIIAKFKIIKNKISETAQKYCIKNPFIITASISATLALLGSGYYLVDKTIINKMGANALNIPGSNLPKNFKNICNFLSGFSEDLKNFFLDAYEEVKKVSFEDIKSDYFHFLNYCKNLTKLIFPNKFNSTDPEQPKKDL